MQSVSLTERCHTLTRGFLFGNRTVAEISIGFNAWAFLCEVYVSIAEMRCVKMCDVPVIARRATGKTINDVTFCAFSVVFRVPRFPFRVSFLLYLVSRNSEIVPRKPTTHDRMMDGRSRIYSIESHPHSHENLRRDVL
jgi:hypothetical protein